ncbi:MAG TPA: glycosyltransferase family 2 protein [Candidatus Janibacter merdipullorum]|nr:glycosyltransferase family 2 protein [Candidatus Janibacter merdipullorum]
MASLQRARSLAAGGVRAVLTGDPAARRRVVDPLRARVLPTPVTGLDPLLAGYARGAEEIGVDDLVATGHRTRSALLREVARELAQRTGAPSWRAGWAELLCTSGDPDLARTGSAVFRELVDDGHADQLTARQSLLHAHTLLLRQAEAGEGAAVLAAQLDQLTALSHDERTDLQTDLAHPSITGDSATWWPLLTRRWREARMLVPRLLTDAELAEVIGSEAVAAFGEDLPVYDRVGPDRGELADRRAGLDARIAAATGRPAPDALPLVSVVVTAYRPGAWLATAVRALLDQTWTQLEVLVVDDASGPEHADEIARLAALDPRARVITRRRNGGAYRARNLGVAEAKGDFLAFLDADDWCHPERIERQVIPLLADPDAVGTHALAIRADEDLRLAWLGYPAVRHNACGLVMPRSTRERVGTFDDVRKSADSEYNARIEAVTGQVPPMVTPPLQITRLRSGSLSRSDFGVGWGVGGRLAYRSAYKSWHRYLASVRARRELPGQPGGVAEYPGGPPPGLDLEWATRHGESDPQREQATNRPFAAPHAWVSPHPLAPFDVLVVDDAADTMVDPMELYGVLERLRDEGLRIALLHRENPARLRLYRKPLLPAVRDLLDATDEVVQVHPEERVEARVTWIRRAEALSVGRPAPDLGAGTVIVTEPTVTRTHRVEPAWTRESVDSELATWGIDPSAALWLPEEAAEACVHQLTEETR